ncbi:hypothetical protein I2492_01185 [Budviciaceae bacterium CWB-B4]|uniref:Uncharacterized protein n=1 Tax=Limnobaculum xujianqingii TaxID=2738837 RepID=A0A9D7AF71_9GAMM|nr:DUF1660 family phage protein [Limnobaculum xujianqingii]MBK5071628.1 hypothetical protein [Limnobaculum xujianqingii]MBK5174937.1 hypothetical protein [Limnobaculum xujianqingii]
MLTPLINYLLCRLYKHQWQRETIIAEAGHCYRCQRCGIVWSVSYRCIVKRAELTLWQAIKNILSSESRKKVL